jgi:uncharacterized protein (DUF302 family)
VSTYSNTISLDLAFDDAVAKVKEAFAAQGFGILTEIDVQATLKNKLGADMERYVILGSCNPDLAHRALAVTRDIGLLLPCNVVVREHDRGVLVQALDPAVIASVPGLPELEPIAAAAGQRIQAALDALVEHVMAGVVACPSCGKHNRVPVTASGTPRCASCQADLPWLVEAGEADFDQATSTRLPVLVDM